MAEKCKACVKTIGARSLKIQCVDCALPFHAQCVSMTKDDIDYYQSENQLWRCENCAKTRRESMRVESELEKPGVNLSDIFDLLTVMREENKKQIKNLEVELGKSVDNCHEKIDDLKTTIKVQTEALKKYESKFEVLQGENKELKNRVRELEINLEESEQYSRINCIEINGLPDKVNENVLEEVKKVGAALGVNITEMVDACHRLGSRRDGRPRGVIVKFTRRAVKEDILLRRRVKRNLNTTHIGEKSSPANVIYINESLTKYKRELHKAARTLQKEKGFGFVWVRNGKILVRPTEGARVVAVTKFEDLEMLRKLSAVPRALDIPTDTRASLEAVK